MKLVKTIIRSVAVLLAGLLAIVLSGPAEAADDAVTMRLVPDAVSLQPGLSNQEVVLIAQLPPKMNVQSAKLWWVNSPGIDIHRLVEPKIPATSDLAWKLRVAAQPGIAKDTVVGFVLEYQLKSEDKS